MNTNVVHRWLREYERAGDHRMVADTTTSAEPVAVQLAAFVPLELPTSMPRASAAPEQAIKVEIHKGALNMVVSWPLSALNDFAHWTAVTLK